MARDLVVRILGDAASLERAFKKSARDATKFQQGMKRTSRTTQGVFGGLTRSLGLVTGALGVAGVAGAARAAFTELTEAQKVTAQTQAVLKSTGAVANVTAGQVDTLATSLLNVSGVDDEVIKSSENLLLTFTNIRNEVGRGNDIFNQATKAALDMSVALGQDMRQSALQLGKALQDPVKGVTALRRAGVALSAQQQDTIKNLVKTGRTLEAQKLILAELTKEFGGSAKAAGDTLGGKLSKLRETALNLGASIAQILTPSIEKLVDRANKWLSNSENQKAVLDTVKQAAGALKTILDALHGAFEKLNAITGSTKRSLELLFVVFVGFKTAKFIGTLAGIAANVGLIGRNAEKSAGQVGGLRGALGRLATPGGIGVALGAGLVAGAAVLATKTKQAQQMMLDAETQTFELGSKLETSLVPRLAAEINAMKAAGVSAGQIITNLRKQLGGSLKADDLIGEAFAFSSGADPKLRARIQGAIGHVQQVVEQEVDKVKPSGRLSNKMFDALIGRGLNLLQDAPLRGQLERLKIISDLITERIETTKKIARKRELEDQLLEVMRDRNQVAQQINQQMLDTLAFNVEKTGATKALQDDIAALRQYEQGIRNVIKAEGNTLARQQELFRTRQQRIELQRQMRQQAIEDAKTAAEAAKAAAAAAKAAVQASQFRALGFTGTGEERVPTGRALRKQLGKIADAVRGTFLDTGATRSLLNRLRRVLSGQFGTLGREVRQRIKEMLDDLFAQLDQAEQKATRRRVVIQQGLQPIAHGATLSAGGIGGTTFNIDSLNLHGVQDVRQLENELIQRSNSRPQPRRGP